MKKTTLVLLMTTLASLNCYSFTETIDTSLFSVSKSTVKFDNSNQQVFDSFSDSKFVMSKEIGQPSLPSQSYLLAVKLHIHLNVFW